LGCLWGVLGEYLKTPLRVPYWVNWMQTPNQTQTPSPVTGQTQTSQGDEFPKELLDFVKRYINEDISLKELADLGLAIEYILEWAVDHGYGADDKLSEIGADIEEEAESAEVN